MNDSRDWKTLVTDGPSHRRYEVLREIAAGGMASVSIGLRRGPEGFERVVALKRALPGQGTVHASRQLAREAHLAARVHHQNVVSVIDVEQVDGALLLVMEYVEGASLAQLISAGALAPRVVARILLDACAGLAAVHGTRGTDGELLGLLHRDVSPQNILVGIDGLSRITDFGLAATADGTRQTVPGTRRGKAGYMAPEYIRHGIATPASDVYALGVIAWEALTGRSLRGRIDTLEQLEARLALEVPPPSALGAPCTPAWDQLVLRTLGLSPLPRLAGARELEVELAKLVTSEADALAARNEVTAVVEATVKDTLEQHRAIVRERLRASTPDFLEDSAVREIPTVQAVPRARHGVRAARNTVKMPGKRSA